MKFGTQREQKVNDDFFKKNFWNRTLGGPYPQKFLPRRAKNRHFWPKIAGIDFKNSLINRQQMLKNNIFCCQQLFATFFFCLPKFWGWSKFLRLFWPFWNFFEHFWKNPLFLRNFCHLWIGSKSWVGVGGVRLWGRLGTNRRYVGVGRNFGQKFLQGPEISTWKSKKSQKIAYFHPTGGW